jgi:hypothetical protein
VGDVGFGWVRAGVTALLSAALVGLAPLPAAQAVDDITLTGTISSVSGAEFRSVYVWGPGGLVFVDVSATNTFSVTGPPGEYYVSVSESGGPQGNWGFSGQTTPTSYTQSTAIQITVPLHSLALDVEYPGGASAPATVQLNCNNPHPSGWNYAQSYAYRDVSAVSSVLVANHAVGDADCELRVEPVDGPIRYAQVPGAATTYTHVVAPGSQVTGTLSDGMGHPAAANLQINAYDDLGRLTGTAVTNAVGHYALELDPSTHKLEVPWVDSAEVEYRLTTVPLDLSVDKVVDLAPAIDPLTLHVRTSGGDPAPSNVSLTCNGLPDSQTLIATQDTYSKIRTGTDLVLPGMATTAGQCYLEVDPILGVRTYEPVPVPNGGGATTVTIDTGITVTGQVTVPGISTFTNATVTVLPDGHESDTVDLQPDGSFTLTGFAAGAGTIYVQVNDPVWGTVDFQRPVTLSEGDDLALAPDLDYLDVYLLGPTGDPGTGSATLTCSGDNGDVNSFTFTSTNQSGTGVLRLPGYAAGVGTCTLNVTWADTTFVTRQVTLDPDVDTALTLLKNGVTLNGDPTASNDDDGVADAVEAYAPNVGDGNADGTPDYEQPDVSSLPENGGVLGSNEDYLTVAGPGSSVLEAVSTDAVAALPDGTLLPDGLLDFTVAGVTPGSSQTVEIFTGPTAGIDSYSAYDPGTGAWTQMPPGLVTIGATSIQLTLTDGGPFDRDPVAGRVRHPGGGTKADTETPVVSGRALTAPNDKGWYDRNVTVRWAVTDNGGSLTAPADTVVSTEGDNVTAWSAQVCDLRANCSVGTMSGLKIDKTDPVVTLAGPVNGATYVLGAVPARRCTGTDPGGSGVPSSACQVVVGGATGAGTVTLAASATDRAGNTTRKTISYKVVYKAGGLVAPSGGSKLKVFKKGSTVVVRVKVLDAKGGAVTSAKAPVWVAPKATGKAKGKPNQSVSTLKPDKGTLLVKRGKFWEYRWGTAKAKKGKTYLLTVRLDDGTIRTVTVGIG